jgi:hypothetical protein
MLRQCPGLDQRRSGAKDDSRASEIRYNASPKCLLFVFSSLALTLTLTLTLVFSPKALYYYASRMKMKLFLLAWMAGATLFVSGCAGWSGPNGLGQRVLVVCKTTPAQQAAAQNLSNQYFSQVASGKKARPVRHYVALQTLDPNAKQRGKYVTARDTAQKKAESQGEPLGSGWVDPSQLHCVMVFDVVTHESVGTDCYVVGDLPKVGDIFTYDTFPAEFVATSAEFVAQ